MSDEAKLPVWETVRAGLTFLAGHWRKFAPGAVLAGLGALIFSQALAAPTLPNLMLGLIVWVGAAAVFRAALFRFALRGEYEGMFGMRLSGDEARLAGVTLIYGAFQLLVFIAAVAPLMVVVLGVAAGSGDPAALEAAETPDALWAALTPAARSAYYMSVLLVVALMTFVAVRLCLVSPATLAEGRIVFLQSWAWTKDNFWRLLAVLILAGLPGMAALWLPAALAQAAAAAGMGAVAIVLGLVSTFAGALVGGMMMAGVLAYLYQGLRPADA